MNKKPGKSDTVCEVAPLVGVTVSAALPVPRSVPVVAVDIAVRAGALLGECPFWSPAEEVLYWEDIDGRSVHRYDPATGADLTRELPGRPGSMVLTSEPGRLLIAAETELV